MSHRRDSADAAEKRRWRRFLDDNRAEFEATGLPQHLYQTRAVFDDFLMHGHLDHHAAPFQFSFAELTQDRATAARELVVRYLAAGYQDPGLVLFGSEEPESIHAAAALRPRELR